MEVKISLFQRFFKAFKKNRFFLVFKITKEIVYETGQLKTLKKFESEIMYENCIEL